MCLIDIANDEKLLQPTISANTTTTETISENYLQAPIYANKLKTTKSNDNTCTDNSRN